ncbi:hypothetical protein [Chromohalobacter sp. 296-RDG]|uniref:hypothetical protein n=1 Tax=Chromohalobacter sp. 296-RDG TaxID=2994062 RepID=UPI002468A84F|nr:hypothetical protein [Chromohalobacter sp. 296-RDG]
MNMNATSSALQSSVSITSLASENDHTISQVILQDSFDRVYLDSFLALDTLLEREEGALEAYRLSGELNEKGGEALEEYEYYKESRRQVLEEAKALSRQFYDIAIPLRKELEEGAEDGATKLPPHIQEAVLTIQRLTISSEGYNKAARIAGECMQKAVDRATAAFDERDEVLARFPSMSEALTNLELLHDQISPEVASIVEHPSYH